MFSKNAFILFFIFIKLSNISSLIIPLLSSKNLSDANGILEILDYFKNSIKYSYISIGLPPQKFQIIFTSLEYDNLIKSEECFSDSKYDISFSKTKTIKYNQNINNYFSVSDYVSFDNSHQNILMEFIHYNSTKNPINNCGLISFGYSEKDKKEYNLFFQLKKSNAINKPIFYFNYTNDDKLLLNIGIEPFEIDNTYIQKKNAIKVPPLLDNDIRKEKYSKYNWNLNISKVFYFNKIPLEKNLDPYVEISRKHTRKIDYFQALLIPEKELIKGPFEYEEKIEYDFFDSLIKENICKKVTFVNRYFFYCKKEYKNMLKNTFPTLYFYHPELNYMFELTYDDLFFERGENIIFGIYFDTNLIEVFEGAYISEWFFGKIFLKKYMFSFDFEKLELRFYKKNNVKKKKKEENENLDNNENKSSKKIYQLGLILVVIFIGVFAFILDRFVRKKHKVNSLLIDYNNKEMEKI